MANQFDERTTTQGFDPAASASVPRAKRDAGLRSYMLRVYNYMASGVLLSGIVALLAVTSGFTQSVMFGGGILPWVIILSPLAIVFAMSFGQNRMSTPTLGVLYWSFATLMGLSLSTLAFRYDGMAIAQAFFATSAAFVSLSLWGYTTKKDLSGWGTFLIMGVVGLIVAMLLNAFVFQSGAMGLAISGLGVLIFAGLTAYDTQKIKSMYQYVARDADLMQRVVLMGALNLYLDFINMFQFLLSFLGRE